MTKDSKIAQLQAQVEASSAEKDTLPAKYEAIVKENEGEIFVWYIMYRKSGNFRCQIIFVVSQGYENKFRENFWTTNN